MSKTSEAQLGALYKTSRLSSNLGVKGQGQQGQKKRKTAESSPLTMQVVRRAPYTVRCTQ